jgi:predicted O-linked N-acetylglucosamine transferase (SPINDLY family)
MADEQNRRQKAIDANSGKPATKKGKTPYVPGGTASDYGLRFNTPSNALVTPQQQGLKSAAQIKREADQAAKDAANAAKSGAGGLSSLDRYTQAIQNMLTSGSYRKPQDDLLAKLTQMYTQAQPQVNTAMNDLSSFLGAQTNPYAGLQAQTTQATPQLSELLQSQGVNQTPLQQLAAVTQAQNTGQSTAFQNLIGSMRDAWKANQAGQMTDVATQKADLQTQLQNALLGAGTQLNTKAAGQQQDLMTMLLSALSKGGKPKKGALL